MRVRVVDLETTGFEPECKVVEIGSYDVQHRLIFDPRHSLVNPGVPIPPHAMAAHHIDDCDVADAPSLGDVWPAFYDDELAAYVAHNAAFESQFLGTALTGSVPWICTWKVSLRAYPDAPGHSNGVLRYWLRPDGLVRELAEPAHRALPDAYVTAHLFCELLKKFSVEEMITISAEPALLPTVTFGKHRGKKWAEVPRDYMAWIVRQPDMDVNIVHTARHHYNKVFAA